MHPDLTESLRAQHAAPADKWEATFRRMIMFDLAKDIELGTSSPITAISPFPTSQQRWSTPAESLTGR